MTLTTDQGSSVETDMVFRCTGLKVNSIAYQSKLSDKMEKNGSLKVDRYLQVEEIKECICHWGLQQYSCVKIGLHCWDAGR